MRIAIAADHAGFELKASLVRWLQQHGHDVHDYGTTSTQAVDYPEYARQVAQAISGRQADRGVLVCGTGIGMAMAANRTNGARAAVLRSTQDAQLSREHNDANIACFGGRMTTPQDAEQWLNVWLDTPFAGGRHERRVQQIDVFPSKEHARS